MKVKRANKSKNRNANGENSKARRVVKWEKRRNGKMAIEMRPTD